MVEPRWPLGIPTRLRPVRVLAAGATSAVWQVRDTQVGADLAVKVVSPVAGSTVDPARRAETEARALARLGDLPGIVHLHEVGRTPGGEAWLSYDLLPGGTLAQHAPLAPVRVAAVGAGLASAMAGAHDRHVCHGDISPDNVVFDADGSPLLADFGMAGLGHAPDDPGGLTPAYAAPERLRGALPGPASDVWSLAATLAAVVDPTERSAEADELRSVLARCSVQEPSQRPAARTLSDALAAVGRR